jgi:hypothetical protein
VQPLSAAIIVKKTVLFTILGFLALTLFGPVIALVSVLLSLAATLLPFVFVGFLVWTLIQLALHGREQTQRNVQQLGQGLAEAFPRLGNKLLAVVRFPYRVASRLGSGIAFAARTAARKAVALMSLLAPFAGMALTGWVVGAVVGAAVATGPDPSSAVLVNGVLGVVLATGVAVALAVAERRRAVQPRSQLS